MYAYFGAYLTLVCFIAIGHGQTFTNPCPGSDQILSGKNCYAYGTEQLSKMEAAEYCRQKGGSLPSIHSTEEMNEIKWILQNRDMAHRNAFPWLPLTYLQNGRILWDDGSPSDFVNFGITNYTLLPGWTCGFIELTKGNLWYSWDCRKVLNVALCKIPKPECSITRKCGQGEGRCKAHGDCTFGLECGFANCKGSQYTATDRCCESSCKPIRKCHVGKGICNLDADCEEGLGCGVNRCFGGEAPKGTKCCYKARCSSLLPCQNGEGPCSTVSDCIWGLKCLSGKCQPKCSPLDRCGDGMGLCSVNTDCLSGHLCQINSCKDPMGKLIHPMSKCCAKGCSDLLPCPKGEGPCSLDTECLWDLKCMDTKCQPRCSSMNRCGDGIGLCSMNTDCLSGHLCQINSCKDPMGRPVQPLAKCCARACSVKNICQLGEGVCSMDSDCFWGLKCGFNNCLPPLYGALDRCCTYKCTRTERCGSSGFQCMSNEDCEDGYLCLAAACINQMGTPLNPSLKCCSKKRIPKLFGAHMHHAFTMEIPLAMSSAHCSKVPNIPFSNMYMRGVIGGVVDGQITVCGGDTAMPKGMYEPGAINSHFKPCYTLDKRLNQWVDFPALPEPKSYARAVMTRQGWWVTGGRTYSYQSTSTTFLYNSSTNSWASGPNLPSERMRHCLLQINGATTFLAGGEGIDGRWMRDAWLYNWDEGKWTELPWSQTTMMAPGYQPCELFTDRSGMQHVIVAGKGLDYKQVDSLNLSTRKWTKLPDLPMEMISSDHISSGRDLLLVNTESQIILQYNEITSTFREIQLRLNNVFGGYLDPVIPIEESALQGC